MLGLIFALVEAGINPFDATAFVLNVYATNLAIVIGNNPVG